MVAVGRPVDRRAAEAALIAAGVGLMRVLDDALLAVALLYVDGPTVVYATRSLTGEVGH